jgi:hypothetical protein
MGKKGMSPIIEGLRKGEEREGHGVFGRRAISEKMCRGALTNLNRNTRRLSGSDLM